MASRMILCGFCRRFTCERAEAGLADKGQETGAVTDGPLLPDNVMIEETYCRDCERFYHQLITFGRGDGRTADWQRTAPPRIRHPPQARSATGTPA